MKLETDYWVVKTRWITCIEKHLPDDYDETDLHALEIYVSSRQEPLYIYFRNEKEMEEKYRELLGMMMFKEEKKKVGRPKKREASELEAPLPQLKEGEKKAGRTQRLNVKDTELQGFKTHELSEQMDGLCISTKTREDENG